MSTKTETAPSKFVESKVVEKTTAGGSRLISFELTTDARRALTVEVKPQPATRTDDDK